MAHWLAADSPLNTLLSTVNDRLWAYVLIGALVACGFYFTWRTGFVQFRMLPEMIRLLGDRPGKKGEKHRHISSFQAFCVSVATRVGTGNLAGVATAIAVGGPGAVFWMWLIALIGGATAFVESTLAQLYKRRAGTAYIGGPAYYILYGLRRPWMATLFAVLMTATFGLSYNSVQSNTICSAMQQAFGWNHNVVGMALVVIAIVIAFGGIRRIAHVSSVIVPFMAIGYFLLSVVVIGMNISRVPEVFSLIIENAFGFGQAAGGAIGVTIMQGIKRGLFSNEAGEGSAPNAAATATVSHPVKQGLIQSLGVFTDTLLVCSCTAFIILLSGLYNHPGLNGIVLTQSALNTHIGPVGTTFVAIAIFFFAFSSIIGNCYYGESNIRFITDSKIALNVFRVFSAGVMVMLGAVSSLEFVWNLGDLSMALITACNLVAIVQLSPKVFFLCKHYREQKRQGIKEPTFTANEMPDLEPDSVQCWQDKTETN